MPIGHSIYVELKYVNVPEEKESVKKFFALDPLPLAEYLSSEGKSLEDVAKCNRVILPTGREYGRAWLLMRGSDARVLWKNHQESWNKFACTIVLTPEGTDDRKEIRISQFALATVSSVNAWNKDYNDPALGDSFGDHYVIAHFVDARFLGKMSDINHEKNSWGEGPYYDGVRDYNLINYRLTDDDNNIEYYYHSLKPGASPGDSRTPWTWLEILKDLWKYLPSSTPPDPSDPFYITENADSNVDFSDAVFPSRGTEDDSWLYNPSEEIPPQNIRFIATNAWDAICELLHHTGNTVWRNKSGKWFVASYSKANTTEFGAYSSKAAPDYADKDTFLEKATWDLPKWKDPATEDNELTYSVLLPEKIRVYFPQTYTAFQSSIYGQDANVVDGGDAAYINPLRSVITTSPVYVDAYGVPGTTVSLMAPRNVITNPQGTFWKDTAYDEGNLTENLDDCQNMAYDLTVLWVKAKTWTDASLSNTYMYYHDISCGVEISAVQWYNGGSGAKTQVLKNPFKYRSGDELFYLGKSHREEILSWEVFRPPNLVQPLHPITRFAIGVLKETIGPVDSTYNQSSSALCRLRYGEYDVATKTILWKSSGKDVRVYNTSLEPIKKDSLVFCHWHVQTRKWLVLYVPKTPKLFTGTLKYDMCPDENGVSSDIRGISDCSETCGSGSGSDGSFEVTLQNPYKLAGQAGDKFFAYHDDCLPSGGLGGEGEDLSCTILQVQHMASELVEHPFPMGTAPDCEETEENLQLESCTIKYQWRQYSVMTCKPTPTQETLISGHYSKVLTDWWVEDLCIKGSYEYIWSLCWCDGADEILHGGVDCNGGSCSQSPGGI